MNACDSDVLHVAHMCCCCMSKEREPLWSDPCLPWQPTSILSQRICCNEHMYYNLYTKGHSSQQVYLHINELDQAEKINNQHYTQHFYWASMLSYVLWSSFLIKPNETLSACHISPSVKATNCEIIQSCVSLTIIWPGLVDQVSLHQSTFSLGLVSSNNSSGFMTCSTCICLCEEGFSFSYSILPLSSLSARGTLNFTDLKTLFHKSEMSVKQQ